MAFNGSLADAVISRLGGALLYFLQLVVAYKTQCMRSYSSEWFFSFPENFADTVDRISIATSMSFVARALSAVPGHVFCYQTISSSAVVLILPSYFICSSNFSTQVPYISPSVRSSLELVSKNMLAGSVRMVYAIIYSLGSA